jgi:hypothetical protein
MTNMLHVLVLKKLLTALYDRKDCNSVETDIDLLNGEGKIIMLFRCKSRHYFILKDITEKVEIFQLNALSEADTINIAASFGWQFEMRAYIVEVKINNRYQP